MGFPHQALPSMALLDVITATAVSIRLGLLPKPHLMAFTNQATSLTSSFSRFFQGSAQTYVAAPSSSDISRSKRMLFVMLAVCFARCAVIFIIWLSIKTSILAGRLGSRSDDFSGRAIGYSAVCVSSILFNLGVLNVLFQSRGAPPDARLSTVLLHMSNSSLAGEQLIISAVEWILFVIVVGTNGVREAPEPRQSSARLVGASQVEPSSSAIEPAPVSTSDLSQSKAVDVVKEREQPVAKAHQKKDYGTLTQSTVTSPTSPAGAATTAGSPETPSSNTSNEGSGEPSASSDIVDIPRDRRRSMQDAKERLDRARENGKVRRRSLWKKIRGKGRESEGAASVAE